MARTAHSTLSAAERAERKAERNNRRRPTRDERRYGVIVLTVRDLLTEEA